MPQEVDVNNLMKAKLHLVVEVSIPENITPETVYKEVNKQLEREIKLSIEKSKGLLPSIVKDMTADDAFEKWLAKNSR